MESQILENKTNKDLIEKNVEDLLLEIDERFISISESFKGKIENVKKHQRVNK
jgi:hypothetical protein